MVGLTVYSVDDPEVSGGSFGVKVPDDTYKAIIVKSEMVQPIHPGDPDDMMIKIVISEGKHQGKEFDLRLSIFNTAPIKPTKPEWTWQKAAYSNIANIAKALGMPTTPSDSSSFHGKPLLIETATTPGKDKETGAHKPEWDKSYIKAFRALPDFGTAKPAHTAHHTTVAENATVHSDLPPWEQSAA